MSRRPRRRANRVWRFPLLATLWLALVSPAAADPTPATAPSSAPAPSTAPSTAKVSTRGAASRPAVAVPVARKRVSVLFTADSAGRFAWPGCRRRVAGKASFAHLLTAARELRQREQRAGYGKPLLLHGGNMIRPDIMGPFLFRDSPKLVPGIAQLLRRIGFDAVGVGLFDFGADPVAVRRFGESLRAEGLRLLAGNVSCKRPTDPTCRQLGLGAGPRYALFERQGVRIAVFGLLRADLTRRILKRSAGSLQAAEPVAWSRKLIKSLRADKKVDVVIALASVNREGDAPKPVLDYVRALGNDAPDLIVANAMYERGSTSGYLRQIERGRAVIVGTDRFAQHLGRARIELARDAGRWKIDKVTVDQFATAGFAPEPAAQKTLGVLLRALCAEVDQQVGRGTFKKPISYTEFLDYMMQVMRRRTRSEIAVINDSAIADTSFPMKNRLTWEKLLRAIRTETSVGYVTISGDRLPLVLGKHVTSKGYGLHVLGLTKVPGKGWQVNGRPLLNGHSYRVAITAFVARGGDGLLSLRKRSEAFTSIDVSVADLATDFFGADGEAEYDKKFNINLQEDWPDLGRRWLLFGDLDLGFSLSSVSVSNGKGNARYSLPLLRRDDLVVLSGNLDLTLGASTRDHALELDVSLGYGQTWTPDENGDLRGDESLDRITGTFVYKLYALRNRYGSRWYMPVPYAEARLITEFTASGECDPMQCTKPQDQTYHYMDLGGTAGVGFLPHPLFFIKVGMAVRGELLTPADAKPEITPSPGIYLGYLLRRWKIIPDVHHPLSFESRLDFYFTDLGGQLRRELTVQSKLLFSLTRRLAFTLGHRLYYFDKRCPGDDLACLMEGDGDKVSLANDFTIGLAIHLDYRLQTF